MAYQILRERCLCCHNCAMECPVGAIDYCGTGYVIDAERCVDCGHCAKVCNVSAAVKVGEQPAAQTHERRNLTADVVVLGAGASGVVAAVRAAQASGGHVIVLEKAAKFGGSGWFAGFSAPVGDGDFLPPMFRNVQKVLVQKGVDPEIIQLANETPRQFFQWFRTLDERVDQYWAPTPRPDGSQVYELKQPRLLFNLKNRDRAIGPGRSTSVMESILVDHFAALGVELLTEHEAISIEKDASGAVCGVLAKDPGGEVHISCRAVISCTGGFVRNDELMSRYAPQFFGGPGEEPTHCFAAPTNTGDVVRLGESAGAYLDRDNFFANVFGPVHHPFSFSLFSFANQSEMVNVNLNGQRFVDESQFGAGAAKIIHQPGRISWSIFDAQTKKTVGERLANGPDRDWMQGYESDFDAELKLDTPLKRADSIEELAGLCGIDPAALAQCIEQYNRFCDAGVDEEFGKRPETMRKIETAPYYAIFGKIATDGAFGGMLVNGRTEVYNGAKSDVIPGLYAAGDNASGWALRPDEEGDVRLMASNECNWAVSSGFVAGTKAAEYLLRAKN